MVGVGMPTSPHSPQLSEAVSPFSPQFSPFSPPHLFCVPHTPTWCNAPSDERGDATGDVHMEDSPLFQTVLADDGAFPPVSTAPTAMEAAGGGRPYGRRSRRSGRRATTSARPQRVFTASHQTPMNKQQAKSLTLDHCDLHDAEGEWSEVAGMGACSCAQVIVM